MPETLQQAVTGLDSRRAVLLVAVLAVAAALAVPATVAADTKTNTTENETTETPEFDQQLVSVAPPEKATLGIDAPGEDPFQIEIDMGDQFHLEATVVDHDDDVRILLATGDVRAEDPDEYLSAENAGLENVAVHANELERDRPPGGLHDLRISVGNETLDHAVLEVKPIVVFDRIDEFEPDESQTIAGQADLDDGERIQVRVRSTGNGAFLLSEEAVVEDERFEATFDASNVQPGADFEVTARHDNQTVGSTTGTVVDSTAGESDDDDRTQESHGVVLVYEGDLLELEAAPDQRIAGEADLEEGESVSVRVRGESDGISFLVTNQTTVDEHGTFEVTVDLDEISPGTEFTVHVRADDDPDVQGSAPGVVVESTDGASDGGDGETDTQIDDGESDDGTLSIPGDALGGIGALVAGAGIAVLGIGLILGIGRRQ
ncbi:cell surface glycoprotein precursor [Halalkaliarchaeum desulfuricum]|uniref:Cell surface glycoprotein n=1 Tax=Halalkaliarchaeum desulfuricum TaxID=2055893 RepID=A0A343TFS2_9EURY|nr:BGTF surface domain-containing protein [Halalkaliarchaeum desulfuricum]AUX07944.1 cell surface glycoprotein precursor [Halalkaliarchaeum desulfuricum]